MNVELRRMRTGLAAASALLALLWSIAGCGGSGSSGFDVSPLTESQAISRAINNGECVPHEQQTICASGVEAQTEDFHGASVVIETPKDPLVCNGPTPALKCTASLAFTTEGFSIPNSLLAAVSENEGGPWALVPVTVSEEVTGPRRVTITVPATPASNTPKPVIAAILVYVGAAPETVPQTAEHLADFGGVDLIYVSSRVDIVVPEIEVVIP
jgi:hypothetical protein